VWETIIYFRFFLKESLWSILTFSRKTPDILLANTDLPTAMKEHYPLANQSLLLILILTNHNTTKENPYRTSVFGCANSTGECQCQDSVDFLDSKFFDAFLLGN
jgi:hypothetical protein